MKAVQTLTCPMEGLLHIITGPWTIYILWFLSEHGDQRFGALKRLVPGISTRMLTERLRMLEHAGVVWRRQALTIPPAVTYGLTARGDNPVGPMMHYVSRRMPERGGAEGGTPEIYFTDPDGLLMQLQDPTYCGGGGYLGSECLPG